MGCLHEPESLYLSTEVFRGDFDILACLQVVLGIEMSPKRHVYTHFSEKNSKKKCLAASMLRSKIFEMRLFLAK